MKKTPPVRLVYRKLGKEKARGQWIEATRTIEVDPRLDGIEHLDVLVHEGTHCLLPYLTEEAVERFATNLATLLWEDGYRKH